MTLLDLEGDEKIRNENDRIKMKRKDKWIGNYIRNEGAKALSESLKINTSLTSLRLYSDKKIRNEKEREEMKWRNE